MSLFGALAAINPVALFATAATGLGNMYSQHRTNQKQADLAREQMRFQERMSNTALQRGVADAEGAGLHAWTIAGSGGASTPQGSQAGLTAPQISLPDMMSYGVSLAQLEMQSKALGIQDKKATADIARTMSDIDVNKAREILLQRGAIKAKAEGTASEVIDRLLKFLINDFKMQPQHNTSPEAFEPNFGFR